MKKRVLTLALALLLALSLLPFGAMAYRESGYRMSKIFQYEDGALIRQIYIQYNDTNGYVTEDTLEPDEIPGSFTIVSSRVYVRDESGRMIREVENHGDRWVVEYTYESMENGSRQIQTNSATGDVKVLEYTWNDQGELSASRTLENGVLTSERFYTCNEDGNVVRQETRSYENGQLVETEYTRVEYDDAGRNTAILYTDANGEDLPDEWLRMTYDADGNLVRVQSGGADGYVSELVYDENGNQLSETTTYADGTVDKLEYTYEPYSVEVGPAFYDVRDDEAYYYHAVDWAVEQGITNGTDETHFSPDLTCTRAQMVTFLWRAAGEPEPKTKNNPFTDVQEGAYYYNAVLWAVENGITNGTGKDTFSPGATVTRGQTVTFLYRYFHEPQIWRDDGSFVDVPADAYYANAVRWALQEEITNGMDANHFQPDSPCTRGQIVTFLYRAMR